MAERWLFEETMALINIWKDQVIKGEFDGTCRDNLVYREISHRLKAAGFYRDVNQCRRKIKLLRGDYRKVKARSKRDNVKDWYHFRFFKAIDEIFNGQASPELEVLHMESADSPFPKDGENNTSVPVFTSQDDGSQDLTEGDSGEIEMSVGVNEDAFIDQEVSALEIKIEPHDVVPDINAPVCGILNGSSSFLEDAGFSGNDEILTGSPCASTNTMNTVNSTGDSSVELVLKGQEKLQKSVEGIERALLRIADSLELIVQRLT